MDIIAERTLDIELPGDPDKKVIRILLGKPAPSGEAWGATYEIHGPGPEEVVQRTVYGVDALQALALVLHVLPAELSRYEHRGRITHQGNPGVGLGLPGEADNDGE